MNCMFPVVCFTAVRVGWDCSCPARHPEAPVPARCGSWPSPSHPAFSPCPKASHILECSACAGLIPPSCRGCLVFPSRGLSKASEAVCSWVSACLRMLSRASPSCTPCGYCWLVPGPGAHPRTLTFARLDEKFTLLLLKLPPLVSFSDAMLGESRCDFILQVSNLYGEVIC